MSLSRGKLKFWITNETNKPNDKEKTREENVFVSSFIQRAVKQSREIICIVILYGISREKREKKPRIIRVHM